MADALRKSYFETDRKNPVTYSDYLQIDDRVEVINGTVYAISAPAIWHQRSLGRVFVQFERQLKGKPCEPFVAPVDVRLFYEEDNSDTTIVQPDILIVCDKSKIMDGSIKGAPDFILEILSESTKTRDMVYKYNLYARSGVKEYWILDPDSMILIKAVLGEDGYYVTQNMLAVDSVSLDTMGIVIDFNEVFAERERPILEFN
jgi:Uma2 family endonuclease